MSESWNCWIFSKDFISSEYSEVPSSKIRMVRDMAGYVRCKQLLWRANCWKSKFTWRLLQLLCICQEQIGSEDTSEIVYYTCTEVLLCCKGLSEVCCSSSLKCTMVLLLQGYGCALDLDLSPVGFTKYISFTGLRLPFKGARVISVLLDKPSLQFLTVITSG